MSDPNGRVIVTDGRNHLELTDDRYDIIVTDPPPPIESYVRRVDEPSSAPDGTRRTGNGVETRLDAPSSQRLYRSVRRPVDANACPRVSRTVGG